MLVADAQHCRETNAHSAGVTVFACDWLGLGWHPGRGPTHHASRVIVAMEECSTVPAMLVGSVYLKTSL